MNTPSELTLKQAAELLHRNVKAFSRACKEGKIPGARKIGGKWSINRAILLGDSSTKHH